jgi:hypothetical protein
MVQDNPPPAGPPGGKAAFLINPSFPMVQVAARGDRAGTKTHIKKPIRKKARKLGVGTRKIY